MPAARKFDNYGLGILKGRYPMRTMNAVHTTQNNKLLTNAVLRRTAILRQALNDNGMDPKLATSMALAELDTFLKPKIRKARQSVAMKQMRAAAAVSLQAQRKRAAASARAAKTFAIERTQAMKEAMARRQANIWSRTSEARKSMARGGQAMWKGTTAAATAMATQARRGRNGIVGGAQRGRNGIVSGARSTARVLDSRIVAPINQRIVRPVRGASYERRIQKILAEMSNLTRQRNMLTPGKGRNVDRIRKINAALNALKKQKNLLNATWTQKNEKAAGWSWLKKFGRRA